MTEDTNIWNSEEEQMANVIKHHIKLRTEYEISVSLVNEFFMTRIQQACKNKDFEQAKELINKCPDHMTRVFARDMMRHMKFKGPCGMCDNLNCTSDHK